MYQYLISIIIISLYVMNLNCLYILYIETILQDNERVNKKRHIICVK